MAKRILAEVEVDISELTLSKEDQMDMWVGKLRKVEVFFKVIYIRLNKKSFNKLWRKTLENETDFIEPVSAIRFIEDVVVGSITKSDLDDERIREISGLDMMQNSSIVTHSESIIEV